MKRDHRRKLTDEQEAEASRLYLGGMAAPDIASLFGYSPSGLWRMLRRMGVQIRSASDAGRLVAQRDGPNVTRTYSVDENYFATIDTPAKARWLGLIASDGCLSQNNRSWQLIIQLQEGDRGHLEAFARDIRYTGLIASAKRDERFSGRGQARLCICSAQLCRDLQRHGVAPKKSLTLQPWQGPPELMRHWWAGMVDGDGTIAQARTGPKPWLLSLVSGSLPIIEAWCAFVAAHSGNTKQAKRDKRGTFYGTYSGVNTPQTMARILYADHQGATPLARKQEAADRLLAVKAAHAYTPPTRWPATLTLEALNAMHAEAGDWASVARSLGVREKSLKSRRDYLKRK